MKDKLHVMIDFETLATTPDAQVLTLGICIFDKNDIIESHEFVFNQDQNRKIDFNTLAWWSNQIGFGKILEKINNQKDSVNMTLMQIKDTLRFMQDTNYYIWSNGADFDLPILKHLFDQYTIKLPYKYSNQRCFRTLKSLFPRILDGLVNDYKHDAKSDAEYQAKAVMNYLKSSP